jgi:hypothetical protein
MGLGVVSNFDLVWFLLKLFWTSYTRAHIMRSSFGVLLLTYKAP